MIDERVEVSVFVYHFRHWLSATVSGLAVYADEFGSIAGV